MNAMRFGLLLIVAIACSNPPEAVPAAAANEPAAPAPVPAAPATSAASEPPPPAAEPDEACAQIIVVAYRGANHAAASLDRPREAAEKRAKELLRKLAQGADFAELAKASSDAKSSAPRAGIIGAYTRRDWPPLHASIRDTLFELAVGETAKEPVPADYGYTIVRRCPVEKARSRHILVRYKGAKNADDAVDRSKAEAKARAEELLAKLAGGADFAGLARTASDDSSKERGGDIGLRSRGVLALEYEKALFALIPNARSGVVETEFGFHIIERLPDAP